MTNNWGKVYLVGAGPGAPELITLKGMHILKQADVVLYDFLAHPTLLTYCSAHTLCICVGKRKGFHVKTQLQINRLLAQYAKKYRYVVRLKGGDPLLFGRGGEEMEFLAKKGIPYEVVPGVSSGTAVPAYVGIPLTHRDYSRSVAFVTGSPKKGDHASDIILPRADTLVFLMGVSQLTTLVPRIIKETAFTAKTPVALIYRGTLSDQEVTLSTLGDLLSGVLPLSPTLIVVGKVAQLSQTLGWTQALPLFGKRIVLLRQSEQAHEWQTRLELMGAEVISLPMIHVNPNPNAQQKLTPEFIQKFDEIILTSPNAAKLTMDALFKNGGDARTCAQIKFTVLGQKTGEALLNMGIKSDRIAPVAIAEGILDCFLSESLKGRRVLLPQSTQARPVLREALSLKGAQVTVLGLYTPKPPKSTVFPVQDGDLVWFTSASTAIHFFGHVGYQGQKIVACCIGPITADEVKKHYKGPILMANFSTFEGLLEVMG